MNNPALPFILITGANGQLGNEFRELHTSFPSFHFYFTSRAELPVDDQEAVDRFFAIHQPNYCINCAAYTAVDKAESDQEAAFRINRDAVKHLAKASRQYGTKLMHISTDYVFNGDSSVPYKEDDETGPGNIYGHSKLEGEKAAIQHNDEAIAIRTSWVYSSFGANFVKTMLRLMKEHESIGVVNDQTGSPTYAYY
ncbi:MAG: NAD(P)-dependent oxidoreductase [Flavitalea sp.]